MNALPSQGRFWIPEAKDKVVRGELSFDPESGGRLDVPEDTAFAHRDGPADAEAASQRLIHGTLEDGRDVTLHECYNSQLRFHLGNSGVPGTSWYVSTLFLGRHLEDPDAPVFGALQMELPHLAAWAEVEGLSVEPAPTNSDSGHQYLVRIPLGLHDLLKSEARRVYVSYATGQHSTRDEVSFSLAANLSIQVQNPMALPSMLDSLVYPLEAFFSFCVGVPLAYTSLLARLRPDTSAAPHSIIEHEVEILTLRVPAPKLGRSLHPAQMRLPRPFLNDHATDALEKWLSAFERFRPTFDSYFAVQFSRDMFLQAQLLNLTQALESYHRRAHGGTYVSKEDFEPVHRRMQEAIPCTIDSDFRASIKGRLRYLSEFSLRKRVGVMFDRFSIPFRMFVDDRSEFINAVADTRNFFTHHEKGEGQNVKEGLELLKLVQKLRMLVEMAMLHEMGVEDEGIRKLCQRPPWSHMLFSAR